MPRNLEVVGGGGAGNLWEVGGEMMGNGLSKMAGTRLKKLETFHKIALLQYCL